MAVMQAVGLRVRVADAPASEQLLPHVGPVVAVGVLQKEEARRLRNDDAAVGKDETGGDVQLLGKDGELVRLAITICVLADRDAVIAHAVGLHVVRVVARLGHPAAAALVPGEGDGLADLRLAGEELEPQVSGHLRALHAALHAEGMLKGDRLRALLVVGDGRAGLALFRFALGKELLPVRLAWRGEGGEQGGAELFGRGVGGDLQHGHERAGGELDDLVERGLPVGVRAQCQRVIAPEHVRAGRGAGGVVEPDGVTPEVAHGGVQRADGVLLRARRIEVEHPHRAGGGSGGVRTEQAAHGGKGGSSHEEAEADIWHKGANPSDSIREGH